MNITSINNLDPHKKKGIYYKTKDVDKTESISQGGVITHLIRKIIYKYDLILQGLTEEEVKNIENEILTSCLTSDTVVIDLTGMDGYLNHKGVTGSPSFTCHATDTQVISLEDGTLEMTVPLYEFDINPAKRLGV